MTEHDTDRDPVVARALRDIHVPDHGAGFWDDLIQRLGAADDTSLPVDRRVATSELPAITVLRPEPAASPAHRMRFLAAAAAVAVVALTVGVVLRGDGDRSAQQAATTATAVAPFGATDDLPGGSEALEPPVAPVPLPVPTRTPEAAVASWVQALGVGDEETAARLLGPGTLRYVEASGASAEGLMLEMEGGYGAWAGVRDLRTTAIDIPDAGAVVVLSGTYEGEGAVDADRLDAIPAVEVESGRWAVEPLARPADDSQPLKLVRPEIHPEGWWTGQAQDAVLQASSDADVTFWFALDDEPAVRSADGSWDPPGLLASQTHRLVVVAVGDGIFVAKAGLFVVEG